MLKGERRYIAFLGSSPLQLYRLRGGRSILRAQSVKVRFPLSFFKLAF